MIEKNNQSKHNSSAEERLLNELKDQLLDPLAAELIGKVKWFFLDGISRNDSDLYPVAITGEGPPLLLIHGFDSCFLEFRRLVPLLSQSHQVIIPDLYGFGFCPRPRRDNYGSEAIISHLIQVLNQIEHSSSVGVIGASMGGSIAMNLAKQENEKINRLLLLSPAGLTSKPSKIPKPFDQVGVWFLSQPMVRKGLCRQAFANPAISVGAAEEQIASIHLKVPGWRMALASFARNGGASSIDSKYPSQPLNIIWGKNDRILQGKQKEEAFNIFSPCIEELDNCGHLPHLDNPQFVADRWLDLTGKLTQ